MNTEKLGRGSLYFIIHILFVILFITTETAQCRDIKQPPEKGAYYTGKYRNLFAEKGYSKKEIQAKLDATWNQLFYGDNEFQRIYYPVDSGMAYILDVASKDVRSEGMSYGMMIALQMNKQDEFNAIWKWVMTYMYNSEGKYQGYFAWHCLPNGEKLSLNPASDGEEWFVMSLFMASGRWGDREGIYNYRAWAESILNSMLHHDNIDGVTPMFDPFYKQIVFVPEGKYASFTDPSYHLPAYYKLWSLWSTVDKQFLADAADTSRAFFKRAVHPKTGLAPDYANFKESWDTGICCNNEHANFLFDAWRTAGNIAIDYAWFATDPWEIEQSDRIQTFFASQGITKYVGLYRVDGTPIESEHSAGIVAMNALTSLAAGNSAQAGLFVDAFWNTEIPSGPYRYYDGMLYLLSMLHVSGNFRIYAPDRSQTIRPKSSQNKRSTNAFLIRLTENC